MKDLFVMKNGASQTDFFNKKDLYEIVHQLDSKMIIKKMVSLTKLYDFLLFTVSLNGEIEEMDRIIMPPPSTTKILRNPTETEQVHINNNDDEPGE